MSANPIRGEAEVVIDGHTFTLAATMEGLARLSVALGRPSMGRFFSWIVSAELDATMESLRHFAVRVVKADGTVLDKAVDVRRAVNEAIGQMRVPDVASMQEALQKLIEPLVAPAKPAGAEGGDAAKGNAPATQH